MGVLCASLALDVANALGAPVAGDWGRDCGWVYSEVLVVWVGVALLLVLGLGCVVCGVMVRVRVRVMVRVSVRVRVSG